MYSRQASPTFHPPGSAPDVLTGMHPVRARIRRADTTRYVQKALAVPCDPRTIETSPVRRPVREPLETDGPATCLI